MESGRILQQRYRIDREIGRGCFGVVYRADDLQTGTPVAVKVLLPEISGDASLRHRLKREAKVVEQLKSPHAVHVFDLAETEDGSLYIVMELLEGQELTELMHGRRRIAPARAAEIARQMLDVLGEAHRKGVIHRDLKPSNVFLCQSDGGGQIVKVFDFGIAKMTGIGEGSVLEETTRLTLSGGVLGTPTYMSPEQCRGEPLTAASDLYSLGVLLYEMLAGAAPFRDPDHLQLMMQHNLQAPPPLPADVSDTRAASAALRALAKEPSDRFASVAEFAAALSEPAAPNRTPPENGPVAAEESSPAAQSVPAAHRTHYRYESKGSPLRRFASKYLLVMLLSLAAIIVLLSRVF